MTDVTLRGVSFSYPGGFLAVDAIDLSVRAGENVAIVGQNGAGKTTTVKLMNGLLKPTKGDVLVGEVNTRDRSCAQISRIVGYVFQNPDDQIFHSSVEEEVRFGPKMMKLTPEEEDKRVKEALAITGMDAFKDENPLNLPLSMRKFVTIAAVLSMGTDVLVFDEPTAGQDLAGNQRLAAILAELHAQGKTVITISHDMEFVADNFERVVVMAKKRIVREGTPREVFWDLDSLEKAMLKQPYACRIYRALGYPEQVLGLDETASKLMEKVNVW